MCVLSLRYWGYYRQTMTKSKGVRADYHNRWKNKLDKIVVRDESTIIHPLPLMKNDSIIIDFICKCGVPTFRSIYNCCNPSGMKCPECIKMDIQLKRRTTISEVNQPGTAIPTPDRMLEIATERDGFTITTPPPRVFNRDYKVQFTCSCGSTGCSKGVRAIHINGGFCIPCAKKTKRGRVEATCMKRFGTRVPAQNKDVSAKMIATAKKNGTTRSNPEYQKKLADAFEAKHGPGIRNTFQLEATKDKITKHFQDTYGVNNPNQVRAIKQKSEATMETKHGVKHALQVPEFMSKCHKTSFQKNKPFTFKTGETVLVMGYEPEALTILEKDGYGVGDIIIGEEFVPEIWYSLENIDHRYYTDIYIPSENRIIEVKSTRTLDIDIEKNRAKMAACMKKGYHTELWIISTKGTIIKKYINDFTDM